jgi:hypothetical protein
MSRFWSVTFFVTHRNTPEVTCRIVHPIRDHAYPGLTPKRCARRTRFRIAFKRCHVRVLSGRCNLPCAQHLSGHEKSMFVIFELFLMRELRGVLRTSAWISSSLRSSCTISVAVTTAAIVNFSLF